MRPDLGKKSPSSPQSSIDNRMFNIAATQHHFNGLTLLHHHARPQHNRLMIDHSSLWQAFTDT